MRGEGGRGVTNCLILTTILSATGYINIIKNKRGRERKGGEWGEVGVTGRGGWAGEWIQEVGYEESTED